jgi:poly-gamma-glutamate capsule biosynthesis protein CapA/YwtB (metallophosphatase superfamily)
MEHRSPFRMAFVGDVLVDRVDPPGAFDAVRDVFEVFDYRFANLEGVYADDPHHAPSAYLPVYASRSNATAIADGIFSAMALAHNHSVDAGHAALLDTRQILLDHGVGVAGAGADIEEARRPAVVHAAGKTVALLAYASMFPAGYEARKNWPGIAPMRALNIYPGTPNHWIPGELSDVRTVPHEEDARQLEQDIADAKQTCDIVVASFHWGDWTRPFHITDHERRTARAAIDAGADVVVGHHHHALRGFEFYRGKPIFYGLGHFVFDAQQIPDRVKALGTWGDDPESYGSLVPRPGSPDSFPFHSDMRITGIAWCEEQPGETPVKAGIIPCLLDIDGDPVMVDPRDPDWQRIVAYLTEACVSQGFAMTLHVEENVPASGITSLVISPSTAE